MHGRRLGMRGWRSGLAGVVTRLEPVRPQSGLSSTPFTGFLQFALNPGFACSCGVSSSPSLADSL
jgi:hypothetical protein